MNKKTKIKSKTNSSNIIKDITTGIVKFFLKICVFVYRFIKYVWYGILWPFVFIIVLFTKLTNKEIDVEKLRKES